MRAVLKEIAVNKRIFTLLFTGFLLSQAPILIAFSTQDYYNELFYDSKNGKFEDYTFITFSGVKKLDLNELQRLAQSSFKSSSVITADRFVTTSALGTVNIVGILTGNETWSPPILKGSTLDGESDGILVGKDLSDNLGNLHMMDQDFIVTGIAGKEESSSYDQKVYMPFCAFPPVMEQEIKRDRTLQLLVRSNEDNKNELNAFLQKVKQTGSFYSVEVANETKNYDKERRSRQDVKELLSLPYELSVMAISSCLLVSSLWIHLKRRDISTRKAFGASNAGLFLFVFSQAFVCAMLSSGLSLVIQWLLAEAGNDMFAYTGLMSQLNPSQWILYLVIPVVLSLIASLIPAIYIVKIEPVQPVKEYSYVSY
ncbi:ABC transporter permease [Bacillus sp. FJAT-42376]|uniref:ABC transporter permease n=1 Tax=Bacillus sp. FJAT-42376 TaxID=2014076 RepID=UPI0013DD973A|nr:ABC transporter permease [Bacillus sp. FJAT-42376]